MTYVHMYLCKFFDPRCESVTHITIINSLLDQKYTCHFLVDMDLYQKAKTSINAYAYATITKENTMLYDLLRMLLCIAYQTTEKGI